MNEEKFTDKAELYEKYRPSYPNELFDYLYQKIGLSENSTISDIGSGTGIFSKELLKRKSKVICVEPNDDMRKICEIELAQYKGFSSLKASAESTTLEEHSVDFITCAQSFHWFKTGDFKIECKRILKPNGKIILIWNTKDTKNYMVQDLYDLNKKYCPNFKGFAGGSQEKNISFENFFKNGNYDLKIFKNNMNVTLEDFIGVSLSASYSPKKDETSYELYVNSLINIFNRYNENDELLIPNDTKCYIGEM